MANYSIAIFICPPATAKIAGRYICLLQGKSGEPDSYYADNSLVDLAQQLGNKVSDWHIVEAALLETGIWYK
jgi:hypothetical protein